MLDLFWELEHSLVAVSELFSNFVNQDLKEKALLYVLPESECHRIYLHTMETCPI
jgi:hypothetical protein